MLGFENIHISLSGSVFYFFIGSLFVVFSFFIYKHTIPKVSGGTKVLLSILRSLILILILFLIFEPLLSVSNISKKKKNTYVFIDNSKSISAKDSVRRSRSISELVTRLSNKSELNTKLFSFGKEIDSVSLNNSSFFFTEQLTNYSSFLDFFKKHESTIESALIVSDGIITAGSDPSYQFEKLQFPVFTVGVGDSTTKRDVEISNVSHNQFIYAGTQTIIQALIRHNGFDGRQIRANFFEEDKLIETKDIRLNNSGTNQFDFSYKPLSGGEKKLSVSITPISGEATELNNIKHFFISVLDTKIKISIIAGSPSADLSAISNILETNSSFSVNKFVQISREKRWDNKNLNSLDSSKVLFLVDFPSSNSSPQLLNQVVSKVENGTPFFISISSASDFGKLKQFDKYLPFYTKSATHDALQVQAEVQRNEYVSNFSQISNSTIFWNNLPPVFQSASEIIPKPESKVIVKAKVKDVILNSPLVILRSIGNQRSFCLNAGNYWRWSLQNSEKNVDYFRSFINEIVKWLSVSNTKRQFNVVTNKKIYSPGEQVKITAELYDYSFNPIDTAHISVLITNSKISKELAMTPQNNGIYTAEFIPDSQGDFNVSANAKSISSIQAKTRFSILSSSLELIDTKMRVEYLKLLANSTSGKYFSINEVDELLTQLENANNKHNSGILVKNEYELWNSIWILFAVIILFAIEWFLRKRLGMI